MQLQRISSPLPAPVSPAGARPAASETLAAPAKNAAQAGLGSDGVRLDRDAALSQLGQQALTQADALEQAWKSSQSGNLVSKTFNSVLGKVTGHDTNAADGIEDAIAAYRALPAQLQKLKTELASAQHQPQKTEALLNSFRKSLQQTEKLGQAAEDKLGLLQSSRKFWSGLTAEITSTLVVNGAAVMASRRLGLPLNAATAAAGFVLGGSANVATHALLDNQYQLKQEGLGNFLTAGVGSAALVITAKSPINSLKRMAATQAVVAATSAGVGATAREYSQGFEAGWQKRVVAGTLIGAGVGVVSGAAGMGLAKLLPQSGNLVAQKSVQVAVGASTGAVGSATAGTLTEALSGFSEGWQQRVQQQAYAGAISGAVLSVGPVLTPKEPGNTETKTVHGAHDGSDSAPAPAPAPGPAPGAGSEPAQAPTQAPKQMPAPDAAPDTAPDIASPDSPEPKPTGQPAPEDVLPLLDYAQNQALRDFDKLLSEHYRTYDTAAASDATPYLVDAKGKVIVPTSSPPLFAEDAVPSGLGGTIGYSSVPSGLVMADGTPVNPPASMMGYGSPPPPQILDASGQPMVPLAMSYAGPPPVILDANGLPMQPLNKPDLGSGVGVPAPVVEIPVPVSPSPPQTATSTSGKILTTGSGLPTGTSAGAVTHVEKFLVDGQTKPLSVVSFQQPYTSTGLETAPRSLHESTSQTYEPGTAKKSSYVYVGNDQPTPLIEKVVFDVPDSPILQTPVEVTQDSIASSWTNYKYAPIDKKISFPMHASIGTSNNLSVNYYMTTQLMATPFFNVSLLPNSGFSNNSLLPPGPATGSQVSASIPGLPGSYANEDPNQSPLSGQTSGVSPYDAAYGSAYGSGYGAYPAAPDTFNPNGGYSQSYAPASQILGADGKPLSADPSGMSYASVYGSPTPQILDSNGDPIGGPQSYEMPKAILGADGKPAKAALKEHIYGEIFRNPALRDTTIKAFTRWTATYSNAGVQKEMRQAFASIMKGKAPSTPLEKAVFDIYTTRQDRWARLADTAGLGGVPKDFQLYRGVKGERFVSAVIDAWRDTKGPDMQVPAYELSSWSLTRNIAESFAGSSDAAVIFEAQVPFERTLADKYVDDGSFITSFSSENEVIVATAESNGLSTPKDKVTVTFKGQKYSYAEREALIQAWDAAQAAAPASPTPPNPQGAVGYGE